MKAKAMKPIPSATLLEKEAAERRAKQNAAMSIAPAFSAAGVVQSFSIFGELDYVELVEQLTDQCRSVQRGDLTREEAILTAQAHSLDAIFASMARRAALNVGEYIGAAETYLKLALKAQSQCRATLETLATIKSPPVVFAKQANIAHGPQQVNNEAAPALAHAAQNSKPQTELLEHDHGERLDTGTAGAASSGYQTVEAVAESDRPAQRRRKGYGQP